MEFKMILFAPVLLMECPTFSKNLKTDKSREDKHILSSGSQTLPYKYKLDRLKIKFCWGVGMGKYIFNKYRPPRGVRG